MKKPYLRFFVCFSACLLLIGSLLLPSSASDGAAAPVFARDPLGRTVLEENGESRILYNGYTLSVTSEDDRAYLVVFDKFSGISLLSFSAKDNRFSVTPIADYGEDGTVTARRYLSSSSLVLSRTTAEIVDAAAEIIYRCEGTYGSVNADDNGALSIGKVQWHAGRALGLMKTIVNADPARALSVLGGALYNEITGASSSAWNNRTVSSAEAGAISALLTTPAGMAAQDALATTDITSYVEHGIALGLRSAPALVYFADLENQSGAGGSARVAAAAALNASSYDTVTLFLLHRAALADASLGRFTSRRDQVYHYALSLGWSEAQADNGLPAFLSEKALSDFRSYYRTVLCEAYPDRAADADRFLNALLSLDVGGMTAFSGATASYRRSFVNTMLHAYLLTPYGYTTASGETDVTRRFRAVRNLMNGKSVVLFFEGASDNVESLYSDAETYHMGAVCLVVRLNAAHLPEICYVNTNSTTVPDRVRHLYSKYQMTDVACTLDGLYNIITVDHDGYAALNVKGDGTAAVPCVRANETGVTVTGTATGINIHSRYTNTVAPTDVNWSNSIGCFMVGLIRSGADPYAEYNAFIRAVTGMAGDAVTSENGSRTAHSCEECGTVRYADQGIVIVDRTLYRDTLEALYGDDRAAGGLSAREIVDTVTAASRAVTAADPNLSAYIAASAGKEDTDTYTITVLPCVNGNLRVDRTAGRAGDTVTVTPLPDEGYSFATLYVDGVAIASRTFTISRNHTLSADFVPARYSLTVRTLSYCTDPTVTGTLTGRDGTVRSVSATDEGWIGQVYQTLTFPDLPAGIYDLTVRKVGHLPYTVADIRLDRSLDLSYHILSLAAGDISDDGFIDSVDITRLVSHLGAEPYSVSDPSDLNGDGYYDALDLTVLAHFLLSTPAVDIFQNFAETH